MSFVTGTTFQEGLTKSQQNKQSDFPFSNDNVYVLAFFVIVENGKSIKPYQTINCISLIFLQGIDTPTKMYQSNLKDYCDTVLYRLQGNKVDFF